MCIPIVIAITFIIFAILSFTPGDPARNKLGNLASKEAVEELREEWGLNDPFLVRYVNYMKGLLHGDMGRSYTKDTVVAEDLKVCSKVTFPILTPSVVSIFKCAFPIKYLANISGNGSPILKTLKLLSLLFMVIYILSFNKFMI